MLSFGILEHFLLLLRSKHLLKEKQLEISVHHEQVLVQILVVLERGYLVQLIGDIELGLLRGSITLDCLPNGITILVNVELTLMGCDCGF